MTVKHLFELPITDYTIIVEQIVSIISSISLFIILLWVIIGLTKQTSLSKRVSIACIISILCFSLFACSSIGWTNLIFPISPLSCQIIFPISIINYNIAKISMYWLFTFQAEMLVKHSAITFNTKWLWIYRYTSALIPSSFWSIWIYQSFIDFKPHKLSQYSHCFPTRFRNINIASHISTILVWTDVSFTGFALGIFVYKLYHATNLVNNYTINNTPNNSNSSLRNGEKCTEHLTRDHNSPYNKFKKSLLCSESTNQEWINTIRKSTILCLIVTLSTWICVLSTEYLFKQCVFYIAFDGVINALCLSFLFNFSNKYYNKCCKYTFEKCFIDIICYCCCKINNKQNNKKIYNERQSMGGASIRGNSTDVNDYTLSHSLKDNNNHDILMNTQVIQKRKNNEEINIENDNINDLLLKTMDNGNLFLEEPLENENINKKESMSNKSSSTQNAECIIKEKKGSFSISNSDDNKSVEFMLLDMTDDENNMIDDDGYYQQDGILKQEDEKRVTDEDVQ